MNSLIPAARASSMAYWIKGRSTNVMISFGTDFVAGKNRVPSPATGKIAFVTLRFIFAPNYKTANQPQHGFGYAGLLTKL